MYLLIEPELLAPIDQPLLCTDGIILLAGDGQCLKGVAFCLLMRALQLFGMSSLDFAAGRPIPIAQLTQLMPAVEPTQRTDDAQQAKSGYHCP
jgi:hypothetical protein